MKPSQYLHLHLNVMSAHTSFSSSSLFLVVGKQLWVHIIETPCHLNDFFLRSPFPHHSEYIEIHRMCTVHIKQVLTGSHYQTQSLCLSCYRAEKNVKPKLVVTSFLVMGIGEKNNESGSKDSFPLPSQFIMPLGLRQMKFCSLHWSLWKHHTIETQWFHCRQRPVNFNNSKHPGVNCACHSFTLTVWGPGSFKLKTAAWGHSLPWTVFSSYILISPLWSRLYAWHQTWLILSTETKHVKWLIKGPSRGGIGS